MSTRRPSRQMIVLLEALAGEGDGWCHGYDLMKATGLASGTLYPLLMRMADRDLIESEWVPPVRPGRPARHAYRLTAAGRALARSVAPQGGVAGGIVPA